MSLWDGLFQHMEQPIAQILLTKNDIADVRNVPDHAEQEETNRF